jgi:hypothetical protein
MYSRGPLSIPIGLHGLLFGSFVVLHTPVATGLWIHADLLSALALAALLQAQSLGPSS